MSLEKSFFSSDIHNSLPIAEPILPPYKMLKSSGIKNPYHYGDDTINIMAYLGRFTSRWPYFMIGLIAALILAFIQIRTSTRVYKVGTKIVLSGLVNSRDGNGDLDKLLVSADLVEETVRRMGTTIAYFQENSFNAKPQYEDRLFSIGIDSSALQLIGLDIYIELLNAKQFQVKAKGNRIKLYDPKSHEVVEIIETIEIDEIVSVGTRFRSEYLSFDVFFFDNDFSFKKEKYFFRIHSLAQRSSFFHKHLKVEPIGEESNIISLTLEGPLVELTKEFLNTHIESYKARKKEIAALEVRKKLEYIDREIFDILSFTTDKSVKQNGRFISDSLPLASWRNLEQKRMQLQKGKLYYESLLNNLKEDKLKPQFLDPKEENDQVLRVLLVKYLHLLEEEEDLALKTARKGPLWQVNQMDLKSTVSDLRRNLEKNIKVLGQELTDIQEELEQISGAKSTKELPPELEDEYYELLQDRRSVLKSLETLSSDAEVIEQARLEGRNPVEPKKSLILLVAVFAGLGMPAGLIVFQDYLNHKMAKPLDIESGTNIPVLGFIARHEQSENYLISSASDVDLYESFRYVRKKMHYLNEGHSLKVIGITSSDSGEGKTFCSTSLAISLADGRHKTLLIDMDLRRPRVSRYFKNKSEKGLADYMNEKSGSIFDLIFQTEIDYLSVLPAGANKINPTELLKGPQLAELIKELRNQYDYIIIDTPPVGLVADYTLLMNYTDFNIYLVRESTTQAHSLNWINGLFDRKEMTNIGLLINDVKPGNKSVYPE